MSSFKTCPICGKKIDYRHKVCRDCYSEKVRELYIQLPTGCLHHWIIDKDFKGQCQKCGAEREFIGDIEEGIKDKVTRKTKKQPRSYLGED